MRIMPCDRVSLYGIRSNRQETLRDYGKVIREVIPLSTSTLEIYTALDLNGKKAHKLYYLKDKLGNWIKSKLVYFSNNKRYKVIRSEKR